MRLHEVLKKMKNGDIACRGADTPQFNFRKINNYGYCVHTEDYPGDECQRYTFSVYDITEADDFEIIKSKKKEHGAKELADFILKTIEDGIKSSELNAETHFKNRIKELRFCLNNDMNGIEDVIISTVRESFCDIFNETIKYFERSGKT